MKVLVVRARQKAGENAKYSEIDVISKDSVVPGAGERCAGQPAMTLRCEAAVAGQLAEAILAAGPLFADVDTRVSVFNSKSGQQQSLEVTSFEPIALLADVHWDGTGIRERKPSPAVSSPGARPAPQARPVPASA